MPNPPSDRDTVARATILIRFVVGIPVFLSEGIQKFVYPAEVGAGRFERIGIPYPELMAPVVGVTEIVCGILVAIGWKTRLAVLPLIGVMVVAIITTKIPVLLGQDLWIFNVRTLPHYGLLPMLHEARTDLAMLFCLTFLYLTSGGRLSLGGRRPNG
ncbi:MAG: DoxX family protein [Gemmatimonadales bacterium]